MLEIKVILSNYCLSMAMFQKVNSSLLFQGGAELSNDYGIFKKYSEEKSNRTSLIPVGEQRITKYNDVTTAFSQTQVKSISTP